MAERRPKSILAELNSYLPERGRDEVIDSRANHVINSAINLLDLMETYYTEEEVEQLTRKLINSIRAKDPDKFSRGIQKLKAVRKDNG